MNPFLFKNFKRKTSNSTLRTLHYLALAVVIVLGAALRFWHLDLKPLWQDEAITALFSLGRSYDDVPQQVVFPLSFLAQLFTLKPEVACSQIAHTVAAQSNHPPLFFCLMHNWLSWLTPLHQSWVWKLRSLPALIGVGAIAGVYCLNRVAFSPAAGLVGAAVMAISPFGVYLSQEARHYTLPVLLCTFALLGLIQIQRDYQQQQLRLLTLLSWVAVNSIGLYVHYFFFLALIAQVVTLVVGYSLYRVGRLQVAGSNPSRTTYQLFFLAFTFCLLPFAFFLPWLPMMIGHFGGSATDWLPPPHDLAPIYQTIVSWLLMVIALPVENQPYWIAGLSGLLMMSYGGWLGWQVFNRLRGQAWQELVYLQRLPAINLGIFTLSLFTLCVMLQLLAIVYLLNKDITVAPRYSFAYYPALCALLGVSFVNGNRRAGEQMTSALPYFPKIHHSLFTVLLVGALGCVLVVFNLAFQKPYNPQQVAQNMNLKLAPVMVVVANAYYQDVALGLSFALELDKVRTSTKDISRRNNAYFAFVQHTEAQTPSGYQSFWPKLSQLEVLTNTPFNMWVIAPELKQVDYPHQLQLASHGDCTIDPNYFQDISISYQLYRCH